MELCLFFMPQCMPYDPYPALPYLTGYLRKRNVDVQQFDANHGFYEYLLEKKNLIEMSKLVKQDFAELKRKKTLNNEEKKKYNNYLKIQNFSGTIIENVEKAVEIMKSTNEFYKPERYYWATNTISAALYLYSSYFYPEKISVADYKFVRGTQTIDDIVMLVEEGKKSLFNDYLEYVLIPYLKEERPSIIGFSMFDVSQFYISLLLVRLIKKHLEYTPKIVFGGILMSFLQNKILRSKTLFDYVDGVLVYEGEKPLYKYVEYVRGKENIQNVPNLIYKLDGEIIQNVIQEFDINDTDLPDYRGINMDHYFSPEKIISVISSKGCHWAKCTFCTQHLISGRGVYVEKDLDKLTEEIIRLKKMYGTSYFWFNDTSIEASRLEKIANQLIKNSCDIIWRCESRLDSKLSNQIIEKIAKSGCKKIGFGMESGSNKILKNIHKGISYKEACRIIKKCYECGIAVQLYFIIGFPGEKLEDVKETLNFITENRKYIATFGFSEMILEEESEYQIYPDKYGIEKLECVNQLNREYYYESKGIGQEKAHQLVNRLIHYYSQEIGEKPFWGDEVESHHLFYLNHYQDPKLNAAKIIKKKAFISDGSYIVLRSKIKVEEIWDERLKSMRETIFLIDNSKYKIYEVNIKMLNFLKKIEHKIMLTKLQKEFVDFESRELLKMLFENDLLDIV